MNCVLTLPLAGRFFVAVGRFAPNAWQIGIIPSGVTCLRGCTACHTPVSRQDEIIDNETIVPIGRTVT
jgi:hypothetical protein